jgi:argininosuccinate lyase
VRDFIGLEHTIDDDYAKRLDHRFHALGCEMSPDFFAPRRRENEEQARLMDRQPWATQTDVAWTICLYRAGAVPLDKAAVVLAALDQVWDDPAGVSGEERVVKVLDGDMDTASIVNYGRTLQEPMYRLKLRDKLLDVIDDVLGLLELTHRIACDNLDTRMIGHTHMNHAQPITYAHYLVSTFDGLYRSLEQLELAYRFTNLNSGGCGSCSGTTWPVDRELMAELLGLDGVLEPTYDSESSQDHSLAIMFGLSNLAVHVSRYSRNQYIWAFDEFDLFRTHPSLCGVSSFMPQKCDSGSQYEWAMMKAADVMSEAVRGMLHLKAEPHGDVQAAFQLPFIAAECMIRARCCIGIYHSMLAHSIPQKERMRKVLRAGFSCATEVASYLVRERGYGGRLAHSIVATMVRKARERGWKSEQCTGELLDEAAGYLGVEKPGLDTATVQQLLDPDAFIRSHHHLGGAAPEANRRLLDKRKTTLAEAAHRQRERRRQVDEAFERLNAESKRIQEEAAVGE